MSYKLSDDDKKDVLGFENRDDFIQNKNDMSEYSNHVDDKTWAIFLYRQTLDYQDTKKKPFYSLMPYKLPDEVKEYVLGFKNEEDDFIIRRDAIIMKEDKKDKVDDRALAIFLHRQTLEFQEQYEDQDPKPIFGLLEGYEFDEYKREYGEGGQAITYEDAETILYGANKSSIKRRISLLNGKKFARVYAYEPKIEKGLTINDNLEKYMPTYDVKPFPNKEVAEQWRKKILDDHPPELPGEIREYLLNKALYEKIITLGYTEAAQAGSDDTTPSTDEEKQQRRKEERLGDLAVLRMARDLSSLEGRNWLSNVPMDYYFKTLQVKHRNVYCLTTWWDKPYIYSSGGLNDEYVIDLNNAAAFLEKDRIEILFAPTNVSLSGEIMGNHWVLILVNFKRKTIHYADSIQEQEHKPYAEKFGFIRRWITENFEHPNWNEGKEFINIVNKLTPRQIDGHNCGVYVAKFAKYAAEGKSYLLPSEAPQFTKYEFDKFRKEMKIDIENSWSNSEPYPPLIL